MGNKSPIQINLQNTSSEHINEDEHLLEKVAQYCLPANYSITQLACFRLPTSQDPSEKFCGKISPTGTTSLRFRLYSSPNGLSLELIPSQATDEAPSSPLPRVSGGVETALSAFLTTAIAKIAAKQSSDGERIQINERFQQAQQRLAEEMTHFMTEQQLRWVQECAERRNFAHHLEKREREKNEIKKEEEKKQEQRLTIQKIEEPKRQSQRLSLTKHRNEPHQ